MIDIQKIARKAGIKNDCDGIWCEADQLAKFAALYREAVVQELVAGSGEPVAFMYPVDHERMTTTETFCTVYSVMAGSPTHGLSTVECYTADQLAGAVARERERCARIADKAARYNRHISVEIAAAIRSGE